MSLLEFHFTPPKTFKLHVTKDKDIEALFKVAYYFNRQY